jgi:hypothetical protein
LSAPPLVWSHNVRDPVSGSKPLTRLLRLKIRRPSL